MTDSSESRRSFMKVSAAGAVVLAAGGSITKEVHAVEINAMNPTVEQIRAFLKLPAKPIVMVNLLKFKPDGGREAYAKYGAAVQPILEKLGARIIFSSTTDLCLLGNADWDSIALVEYPTPQTLLKMAQSPEYQAIHHFREEGLEGQVNYAVTQQTSL